MNKTNNKNRPVGAEPTPEQLRDKAKRVLIQKRNSLAEIILSNALQAAGNTIDYKPYVDAAVEAADYMMEKLFGVEIKSEEKKEE